MTCLCICQCRKPYHSINFVIAHDGFTLHDLVAYNDKHNQANGEGNRESLRLLCCVSALANV